jgi:hypothetical protein
MPTVKATLRDVSTTFVPIAPDDYFFRIEKVEQEVEEPSSGRPKGQVIDTLHLRVDDPGSDENGRPVRESFYTYAYKNTPEGALNERAQQDLKRYFEAAFGKEEVAGWEDAQFNTDDLVGRRVFASVYHESYPIKKNGIETGEQGTSVRLKNVMSVEDAPR